MRYFKCNGIEIDFEKLQVRHYGTINGSINWVGSWKELHYDISMTNEKIKQAYKKYIFDKTIKRVLLND